MIDAAARLRRVAQSLRSGKAVPSDDADYVADAFDAALAGEVDLDEALGLIVDPVERRRELIVELASHLDGSISGRAKAIAALAGRYATSGWLRDRQNEALPVQRRGTPDEILHALHRLAESTGIAWPLCWRSLYESLQSRGLAVANNSVAES